MSGVVGSVLLIYGATVCKSRDQMTNWRWDNTRSFGEPVDRSNPQSTGSGKIKLTGEPFCLSSSDDLSTKIELPSCRQYKPGNFLAIGPLNWDEIINEDDDNENLADAGGPRG